MSKADQKAAKSQANATIAANTAQSGQMNTQLQGILSGAQGVGGSVLPSVVSGYTDIASTGGISPDQVSAMQNRASEAARSTYDTGAAAASRATAATGGYGMSGAIANTLARKGSEAAAQGAVDTSASIAGLQSQNKLAAVGGLANVYGLSQNEVESTVNAILNNYKSTGELNNQDLTIITNLANQPGVFDKIVGTIGTLGGAAAGILSATKPGVRIG